MPDTEKQSLKRRVYLLIFLQLLVPGIGFGVVIFIISLFRTGRVAEYTRFAALFAFFVFLAAGILRAFLVFALNRWRNRKGLDDIY
jgi:ABC-type thiamin/hydroxymethylpyrimidine transport system permease subunit